MIWNGFERVNRSFCQHYAFPILRTFEHHPELHGGVSTPAFFESIIVALAER